MGVQYRQLILDRGDELLLNDDVVEAGLRVHALAEATGIPADEFVFCPLVATPVPIYRRGQRFSTAKPEALWHPLLWLPESVGLRLRLRQPDGSAVVENDTQWLTRVALELQHSGLYSTEHGWVDILSLYGLDVNDPVDIARVEYWLNGGEDTTLDSIDLARSFQLGDSVWAATAARAAIDMLSPIQWLYSASSLYEHLTKQGPSQFTPLHEFAKITFEHLPEELLAGVTAATDTDELLVAFENIIAVYMREPSELAA